MTVEIGPLTDDTWAALAALFREGGDPRWCWCQLWRLCSKDFAPLKVPQLVARLRQQVRTGPAPGLVAFEGDRAVVADRASDPSKVHPRVVVRREL